jgi:hypothetical protein
MYGQITAAKGADEGTVDTLVAVPHTAGSAAIEYTTTVSADAGDKFEITVDATYDHLLMLVDTTSAEDPTILGYLSMSAGDGTVVNVTTTDASSDVDMGEVEAEDGEAVSSESLAGVFELSDSEFAALADGDDAFKNISNIWLNYDADSGEYVRPDLNFSFRGDFSDSATAGAFSFGSVWPVINTNHPALVAGFSDACAGDLSVQIVPPGEVALDNGSTFGPDTPLTNTDLNEWCSGAGLSMQQWSTGSEVAIAFGGGVTTQLPSGWWTLEVDGAEVGAFQLDLAMPTDATGAPAVPVPSLELTEDAAGIDAVVKWWAYDSGSGAYVQVEDVALIEKLFAQSAISFSEENSTGEWEGGWDADPVITSGRFDGWTLDGTGATSGKIAREVVVAYQMAGSQYVFTWGGNAICGNGTPEGDEECDGSPVDTCATLGLFEPGTVECNSDCEQVIDCPEGAVVEWLSGAPLAEDDGSYIDEAMRTLPFFAYGGPDITALVGVRVEPDAYEVLQHGPVFAELVLDPAEPGLVVPGGPVSLGTLELGQAATAWFHVTHCPGGAASTCVAATPSLTQASLVLSGGSPGGAALVTLDLPDLLVVEAVEKVDGHTASSGPDQPVLGGVHEVVAEFPADPISTLTGAESHHGVTPQVASSSAETLELLALELSYTTATGAAVDMCADPYCVGLLPDPILDLAYAYSETSATQLRMVAEYRWLNDTESVSVRPMRDHMAGVELRATEGYTSDSLALPAAANATTITEVYGGTVSAPAVPAGVDFGPIFANTSDVDVVMDRLEVVLPGELTYNSDSQATWQPMDEGANTWLHEPVVDGDTITWYGRFRVPAGEGSWFGFQTLASSFGVHSASVRGYVGDTAIDLTLDTSDDTPGVGTITLTEE